MSRVERAFEHLRAANPVDTDDHPPFDMTGRQMLAVVRDDHETLASMPRRWKRSVLIAAASAVVVLLAFTPALVRFASPEPAPVGSAGPTAPGPARLQDSQGQVLGVGSYRTDALGVELTADLDSAWFLEAHLDGFVMMQRTRTVLDGRPPYIALIRPTGLADLGTSADRIRPERALPVDDIAGWLARFGTRIGAGSLREVQLGGLAGVTFDVAVPADASCGDGPSCLPFATNRGVAEVRFEAGRSHRVWWLPVEGSQPVMILALDPDEDALVVIDSMRFGSSGPHPIGEGNPWELGFAADVPPGAVFIPRFGGVRFDLPVESRITQDESMVAIEAGVGELAIFRPFSDSRGDDVATIDALVSALEDAPAIVTEQDETTIGGVPARAFEIAAGDATGPPIFGISRRPDGTALTWPVPTAAEVWIIDLPSGPVVVAAWVVGLDVLPEDVLSLSAALIETLAFDDAG